MLVHAGVNAYLCPLFLLSFAHILQILDYTKRGHYQLACGRYFNHQQNQEQDYSPNHPNQYFEEGYKLANTKPDGKFIGARYSHFDGKIITTYFKSSVPTCHISVSVFHSHVKVNLHS